MGSANSKKKIINVKQISIDEFYEKILRETQPVPIDSVPSNTTSTNEKLFQSKYLIQPKAIKSSPFLIDQSTGQPVLIDLRSGTSTSVHFPISQSSRLILTSSNTLLIISSRTVTQIEFPSLKQTKFAPMSINREDFSVTTLESKILVSGGMVEGTETNTCEMFDGEGWRRISALNEGRSWHSSIEHMGAVYVFGGFRTNSIERLQGRWKLLVDRLPACVNRIGLAPLSERILVVGGEVIGQGFNVSGWEFDVASERLLSIKSVNFQVFFYESGCYHEGIAYLMGSGVTLGYDQHYKSFTVFT